MKERSALAGSLVAGLLASICCIGPLLLGAVGLGSLGFAAALAPLRPWFLGLTGVLIAVGFFLAYRPLRAKACAPGEACTGPASRRNQRLTLWAVSLVAVSLATYPSWGRPSARRAPRSFVEASSLVVLDVQGMTCSGCEAGVQRELLNVPGVANAVVSYDRKRAEIRFAGTRPSVEELVAAVDKAGYHASLSRQR